jgi:hypothetical protein
MNPVKNKFYVDKKISSTNGLDLWMKMEEKSKEYISDYKSKFESKIVFEKSKWYCLCFLSDLHFGSDGVNYKKAREDAELIGSNPYTFSVLGGDYIDNFISAKIIEPLIQATTTPSQQITLFEEYLKFFNKNIMLMISGNHDDRTKKITGLDFLKVIADKEKILYSPDVHIFSVKNGNANYTLSIRHSTRFSSMYNYTHSVKQSRRFGEHEYDIGVICHQHTPAVEDCYIQGNHFIAIRTGSYKVADSYCKKTDFPESKPISPCVILAPNEKKMISMKYLDEAIDFVTYKNKKGK